MTEESSKIDRRRFLKSIAAAAVSTAAVAESGELAEAIPAELQSSPHPLDPLTSREIEAVSRLLKSTGRTDQNSLSSTITLAPHNSDQSSGRFALAVVYQADKDSTHEHLVDLNSGSVVQSHPVQGCRASSVESEYRRAIDVALTSGEFIRALARRGITDRRQVFLEAWSPGPLPVGDAPLASTGRLIRLVPYYQDGAPTSYGRPIEGLVVSVDLRKRNPQGGRGAVVHVLDTGPVPSSPQAPKPAIGKRPARPQVQGSLVSWGPWQFRTALRDREGLVLYDVQIRDGNRLRSLLRSASVAEMMVLYGDPSQGWGWRNAFDAGDYGLGRTSVPLRPGSEVPPGAILMDGVISDELGKAKPLPNRIAIYEHDAGILWSHSEDGEAITRRCNEIWLISIAAVGNYDFIFHWIFADDGRLTFRVDLTGIMLAKGTRQNQCAACELPPNPKGRILAGDAAHGTQVARNLIAVNHQHLLNMRLDFNIDGVGNGVRELEHVMLPQGPENPLGNGFTVRETALLTEKAARRDAAPGRYWKVINSERAGPLGHFPGYMIHPQGLPSAIPRPANATGAMSGFMDHAFWATKRRQGENYACGIYLDSENRQGLPEWSEKDERIEGQDLVVWYTLGATHIPRTEEWPIMPVSRMGFDLVPCNFFEANPVT
jgi:primary-amine oxidase